MIDAVGAPFYDTFVGQMLAEIDLLLHSYVYNGYAALSDYLRIPLGIISTIYIIILGYSIAMGWVKMSMGQFVKSALKIGFIYMAVTEWAWVSQNFVELIDSAIGEIGDALASASPMHIPAVGGISGAMQLILIQFMKIGSTLFKSGGVSNIGGLIGGVTIWLFGSLIIGIALFEIILAKVMLAILFVFTPLIVIFCYFKIFQTIFDRWLGAIIGFALMQLFVTASLALALSLCYWWTGAHIAESALKIGNYGVGTMILIGIISIGLVIKSVNLAQNLGGTATSSSGSAMLGGMIGGAVGSSLSTLKTASKAGAAAGKFGKYVAGGISSDIKGMMNKVRSSLRGGD